MKKNLLLILLLLFFVPTIANAELCTSSVQNRIKQGAYNVNFTYELVVDREYGSGYYFYVTATNLTKDLKVKYAGVEYYYNSDEKKPSEVKINVPLSGGLTYEFLMFGTSENGCVDEYIYSKKVTLPIYNIYSIHEACIGHEEVSICKKWYNGKIEDEEDFLFKLEQLTKSNDKGEEQKTEITGKNSFDKIIEFYIKNISYTLPITIFIFIFIIILIIKSIKKRKKIIKLDL